MLTPNHSSIRKVEIEIQGIDIRNMKLLPDKTGDVIEDAQLMRIFSNKVVLVRSNGQQEVLYLREKDAKTDPI